MVLTTDATINTYSKNRSMIEAATPNAIVNEHNKNDNNKKNHNASSFLRFPPNVAKKSKFPPGCLVVANDQGEALYGQVEEVGIKLHDDQDDRRVNQYKIRLINDSSSSSVIFMERDLLFSNGAHIWVYKPQVKTTTMTAKNVWFRAICMGNLRQKPSSVYYSAQILCDNYEILHGIRPSHLKARTSDIPPQKPPKETVMMRDIVVDSDRSSPDVSSIDSISSLETSSIMSSAVTKQQRGSQQQRPKRVSTTSISSSSNGSSKNNGNDKNMNNTPAWNSNNNAMARAILEQKSSTRSSMLSTVRSEPTASILSNSTHNSNKRKAEGKTKNYKKTEFSRIMEVLASKPSSMTTTTSSRSSYLAQVGSRMNGSLSKTGTTEKSLNFAMPETVQNVSQIVIPRKKKKTAHKTVSFGATPEFSPSSKLRLSYENTTASPTESVPLEGWVQNGASLPPSGTKIHDFATSGATNTANAIGDVPVNKGTTFIQELNDNNNNEEKVPTDFRTTGNTTRKTTYGFKKKLQGQSKDGRFGPRGFQPAQYHQPGIVVLKVEPCIPLPQSLTPLCKLRLRLPSYFGSHFYVKSFTIGSAFKGICNAYSCVLELKIKRSYNGATSLINVFIKGPNTQLIEQARMAIKYKLMIALPVELRRCFLYTIGIWNELRRSIVQRDMVHILNPFPSGVDDRFQWISVLKASNHGSGSNEEIDIGLFENQDMKEKLDELYPFVLVEFVDPEAIGFTELHPRIIITGENPDEVAECRKYLVQTCAGRSSSSECRNYCNTID